MAGANVQLLALYESTGVDTAITDYLVGLTPILMCIILQYKTTIRSTFSGLDNGDCGKGGD